MLFSQRYALKSIKTAIQMDSMDDNLRNGLWNCLTTHCLDPIRQHHTRGVTGVGSVPIGNAKAFMSKLWDDFFKKPIDIMPVTYPKIYTCIRSYYFSSSWCGVYDILEWITKNHYSGPLSVLLIGKCNGILSKELSGYRFVGELITPLTSDEEISAVEEAMKVPDPFRGPRRQVESALEKLSDRKLPDYAGSIKDSISAVEGILRTIAKEQVTSFDNALMWIKKRRIIDLHPALENAFRKMYNYTSDSKQGIRHALLDEPNLAFEDAKYMLVVCSAFVNYLIAKLPRGKNNK